MKRLVTVLALFLIASQAFAQSDVGPKPGNGNGAPPVMGPPPVLKVATVDLGNIYDKWSKVTDFTTELGKQKTAQEDQLKGMEKEIKDQITIRDTPGINPKIRMGAQATIVQLQAKADFMMKAWNEQVKQTLDEGIAKFFDEIQAEIATWAKANGYTLVLKTESDVLGDDQDKSHVDEKIARRVVLFADPGFDATGVILAILDAKYAKEKAAGPKEPEKDPK